MRTFQWFHPSLDRPAEQETDDGREETTNLSASEEGERMEFPTLEAIENSSKQASEEVLACPWCDYLIRRPRKVRPQQANDGESEEEDDEREPNGDTEHYHIYCRYSHVKDL